MTYISRETAYKTLTEYYHHSSGVQHTVLREALNLVPSADVVARDCYARILAENDTMREQLAQIGKKPGDSMDDVRQVAEFSDAVDEVRDFLNENYNRMPYRIYSALFDLVCGICPNCGADMRGDKNGQIGEKDNG